MSTGELMMEGLEIMLYGIGFVYLFLMLLIYCIKGMSWAVTRFAPVHPVHATAAPLHVSHATSAPAASSEELAAIQSAINQHRARRG